MFRIRLMLLDKNDVPDFVDSPQRFETDPFKDQYSSGTSETPNPMN